VITLVLVRGRKNIITKGKEIHMILDNYSTHKHPQVKEWLERHPRYHLDFTPNSASWLNQIKSWFSIPTHHQIRRGVLKSVKDLVDAIEKYIATHNQGRSSFTRTKPSEKILAKAINHKDTTATRHYLVLHSWNYC
jgi:transposase